MPRAALQIEITKKDHDGSDYYYTSRLVECSEVTSSPRAITLATCLTVLCGAAISWPIYKATAEERKLVEVAKQLRRQAE